MDVNANEQEPERPGCESDDCHEQESQEQEKRNPGWLFGPHADILHMPHRSPVPISVETTNELAKRQVIPSFLVEARSRDSNIETDHQMEEVGLEVSRTKSKLPTFPSASDLHTRDDDDKMPSQLEVNTAVDEMVGRLMSPEDMAADKAIEMSPEDIKDMEAAKKKCVFQRGKFCGTIQHFVTKSGCFQSAKHCYDQMPSCTNNNDAKKADDKDMAKEGCWTWSQMCSQEVMFCITCGEKDQPMCKSKHFKPLKPMDTN